jgi:hypothetical protein
MNSERRQRCRTGVEPICACYNLIRSLREASRSSTACNKVLPSRPASRAAVLSAVARRGSFRLTSVSRVAARTDLTGKLLVQFLARGKI